jgi:hypothetical protein
MCRCIPWLPELPMGRLPTDCYAVEYWQKAVGGIRYCRNFRDQAYNRNVDSAETSSQNQAAGKTDQPDHALIQAFLISLLTASAVHRWRSNVIADPFPSQVYEVAIAGLHWR